MKKMKIKIKFLSIKFILIIILLENIITKAILIANGISNGKCHNETGEYSYSFNIKAVLTGNLSQLMLDKFNIKNNYNDNKLKIKCNLTEEKNNVIDENILINCNINNVIYNNISLFFEGTNDNLELINFNEKFLYFENIFCQKEIILILGKIKDEKYKIKNSLYYYNYKIEILNKTIPKYIELFNYKFNLNPTNLNNNENEYNITCNIVNNDNNFFLDCSLLCYKQIKDYFYYNKGYIYKKEINNDINIYIKNLNDNLYIGKNVDVDIEYKNKIKNINLRNIDIYDITDSISNGFSFSFDITIVTSIPTPIPTSIPTSTPSDSTFNKKCFHLCSVCSTFNNCSECKNDRYIIQKGKNMCVSCFSLNEGCETCKAEKICTKCYNNNIFQFNLNNNGLCENKNENNNNNEAINLKYERFDGYNKEDNTIYFNSHFILLNHYLYNAELTLINTIINTNKLSLRDLVIITQDIHCSQYGDSLGNINKGGYLVNFQCSITLENGEELSSIQPESLKIKFNNNNITIKYFQSEQISKEELSKTSLDEEYEYSSFHKFSISKISDIKLKDDLTFNIIGEYIKYIDTETNTDSDYDVELQYNDNNKIKASCNFKEEKNDTLSCKINRSDIIEKEELSFIEGIYPSLNNINEKLILSNLDDEKVKIPKKTLSIGAIVGITIAGIVILVPFIYYIVKYFIEKKELNNVNEEIGIEIEERNKEEIPKNEGSKQILFNLNS